MKLGDKLARLGGAGPGSRPPSGAPAPAACALTGDPMAPAASALTSDPMAPVASGLTSDPARGFEPGGAPAPNADADAERARRIAFLRERMARIGSGATRARHPGAGPRRAPAPHPRAWGRATAFMDSVELPSALDVGGLVARTGIMPGELRETKHGPVQIVEELYDAGHHHGDAPVAAALRASAGKLAGLTLDATLCGVDLSRMLLLDTETTGLTAGAGTLPFLIGMAWFDDGALRLQQLLLRTPGEETPMLGLLAERIAAASCVVTYNGKSFDWPLLRTRFVMNRLLPPSLPPHVDLLHCARRVFKRRLEGKRLSTLEREVLGFERIGDIDGALIPAIYFAYLHHGDGTHLGVVLEHNAHDLVALAAVLGYLAERFARAPADRACDDPRDRMSMAELALRNRDLDRALAFARIAADIARDDALTIEALRLSARLFKRRRDASAALRCLCEALALAGDGTATAAAVHLALAKLYEHRLRDPTTALAHAVAGAAAESPAEHARRRARIERRIERVKRA